MVNNIDIANALIDIGGYLKANANIKDFCMTQLGKEIKVIAGDTLRRQSPGVNDAPFVALYDFDKREGMDIEWCRYRCKMFVGVQVAGNPDFVEAEGVYILDAYDVTAKLMNLIITELNKYDGGSRPLSVVETEGPGPIEADGSFWGGFVNCTWRLYNTLNMGINTKF